MPGQAALRGKSRRNSYRLAPLPTGSERRLHRVFQSPELAILGALRPSRWSSIPPWHRLHLVSPGGKGGHHMSLYKLRRWIVVVVLSVSTSTTAARASWAP